ncbi:MAG: hypothetical protein HY726_02860 [Candidatus Rokubacteria bacterium]|nr:hypothetical protein [Candidatus Rokubacteria bacterium]
MTSPSHANEYCEDQFMVSPGASGVVVTFGVSPLQPAGHASPSPNDLVRIRMNLQHAKLMAMILRRDLKAYERTNGISIEVPPKLYSGLGVSSQDW